MSAGAPSFLIARALVVRGWLKWQSRDHRGAIADLSAALQRPGITKIDRVAATLNRGLIRYQIDDREGAVVDYSAVLSLPRVQTEARAIALDCAELYCRRSRYCFMNE